MHTFYCSLFMLLGLLAGLPASGLVKEDSLGRYDKLDSSDLLVASFSYKSGTQRLGGVATLAVPENYRFLDAAQSRVLVERLWGNAENPNTLGMLMPERMSPLDKDCWGFVVSFEPSGYLDDQEAGKINYNRLLREMKEELKMDNMLRSSRGGGVITSMDWAFPPYYNKSDHSLHWARILHFEHRGQPVLNYELRLLGRRGALCFTAVGNASRLKQIREKLPEIAAAARFTNGNGYNDFNPRTDEPARWTPETPSLTSRFLSPENLLLGLRSTLSMLLVALSMVLFIYVMQYYHQRRRSGYRKMMDIDERLN